MTTREKLRIMKRTNEDNARRDRAHAAATHRATAPVLDPQNSDTLKRLYRTIDDAEREIARMQARAEQIEARPALNEERKQRFLKRLRGEIAGQRRARAEALHGLNVYREAVCGAGRCQ